MKKVFIYIKKLPKDYYFYDFKLGCGYTFKVKDESVYKLSNYVSSWHTLLVNDSLRPIYIKNFNEYFLTLEEYRNKKLESIL